MLVKDWPVVMEGRLEAAMADWMAAVSSVTPSPVLC